MRFGKVMVTGSSGFIGRNIAEHFSTSGIEVLNPSHKELDMTNAEDVLRYVKEKRPDQIVHAANYGGNRKQTGPDVVGINMRMFMSIYRCRNEVDQIFHLGSGAEYDRRHYRPRMAESYFGAHLPSDDYGFSKYCISELAQGTDNITVLRLFGVFGKYEDHEFRFISNAVVKNLLGIPISIQQNVRFDYIWAPDVARVLERLMGRKAEERAYNLCTGTTVDLVTLAEKINEVSHHPVPINIVNPGMNVEYSGDNSKLMRELGDFSFTPLDVSLPELFRHYRAKLPEIDADAIAADVYASKCDVKK